MTSVSLRENWPLLIGFLMVVMGVGAIVGVITPPGAWFAELAVPDFILPDLVGGLLWLLLCVCFAVSGWRLWIIDSSATQTKLWLATLILSWFFSPVFFAMRMPALALAVIVGLFALMVAFILHTWNFDRLSAWLFIPCLVWVGYAVAMTAAIVALN